MNKIDKLRDQEPRKDCYRLFERIYRTANNFIFMNREEDKVGLVFDGACVELASAKDIENYNFRDMEELLFMTLEFLVADRDPEVEGYDSFDHQPAFKQRMDLEYGVGYIEQRLCTQRALFYCWRQHRGSVVQRS